MSDNDKTHILPKPNQPAAKGNNSDEAITRITGRGEMKIGHLAIIDGPGKGASLPVFAGQNDISRSDTARIQLNFGDNTISRDPPVLLECDAKQKSFLLRDNNHPNAVAINGTRLQGAKAVVDGDRITIGKTTLQFTVA